VENRLRGLTWAPADFIVQPIEPLDWLARVRSVLRSKALLMRFPSPQIELASKVVERHRQLEELAGELRAERDALRTPSTFIEDGLLLVDASGHVQIRETMPSVACGRAGLRSLAFGRAPVLRRPGWKRGRIPSMRGEAGGFGPRRRRQERNLDRTFSLTGASSKRAPYLRRAAVFGSMCAT